ncbi:MAG: polyprenol monophosphomannose synthase [Acidobacteriota bacterium]
MTPLTTIAASTGFPFERPDAAKRLGLIVPTLNEAANVQDVLEQARAALDDAAIPFEILVVDDQSCDGTGALVSAIAREDPRIRLIVRNGKRGLAGAILDGWRQTGAEVLGVMDADGQHPPGLLPALYQAIAAGSDLAIGSRYMPGAGIGDWNAVRKLLSSAAVWATWPLQRRGARAHDPMSGYFLVRRSCIDGIAFQRSGFKLLLEILIRSRAEAVEEIPFAFGVRWHGESKAGMRVGWDYARLLFRLYVGKYGLGRQQRMGESFES